MSIQAYIDQYLHWLKSEIYTKKIGEYYEITFPFMDADNDYIQFYVKQEDNRFFFTDDGFTLNSLEANGLVLTPNRKQLLSGILSQFGAVCTDHEITMTSPASEFPQHKHMFIQALIHINDMYLTTRSKVSTLFTDDISEFFDSREIYCTQNIQIVGKSGFAHNYDFLIQQTKVKPTRLCMAVNNPTKTNMSNVLFSWIDTKDARNDNSQLIVFLNDDNNIQRGVEDGFENYNAKTIRWSQRDTQEHLELLSA